MWSKHEQFAFGLVPFPTFSSTVCVPSCSRVRIFAAVHVYPPSFHRFFSRDQAEPPVSQHFVLTRSGSRSRVVEKQSIVFRNFAVEYCRGLFIGVLHSVVLTSSSPFLTCAGHAVMTHDVPLTPYLLIIWSLEETRAHF